MSRGGWDDARDDERDEAVHNSQGPGHGAGQGGAVDAVHDPVHGALHNGTRDPGNLDLGRDQPGLTLETPARDVRQHVRDDRGRDYRLRESEWQILETVGTFRVVAERDLLDGDTPKSREESSRSGEDPTRGCEDPARSDATTTRADLQHLAESRLIERKTAIVNHHPTRLVVLTPAGKSLLDGHREERGDRDQRYYAGFVKPRELAHDVQLFRAYRAEQDLAEADGRHITKVTLDYELKRDYQAFLNRRDRPEDATLEADRQAFAEAHHLPIVDGHLELPDLRLEIENPDGSREVRDVEVVTEHYSRSQLAGKQQAGFAIYRPARVGAFGRGGDARGGPVNPHTLDWLR